MLGLQQTACYQDTSPQTIFNMFSKSLFFKSFIPEPLLREHMAKQICLCSGRSTLENQNLLDFFSFKPNLLSMFNKPNMVHPPGDVTSWTEAQASSIGWPRLSTIILLMELSKVLNETLKNEIFYRLCICSSYYNLMQTDILVPISEKSLTINLLISASKVHSKVLLILRNDTQHNFKSSQIDLAK